MHVNDFINSLPRIQKKKVWKVVDRKTGKIVQYVGSTDNRKDTATRYIIQKHPGLDFMILFSHFKGNVVV